MILRDYHMHTIRCDAVATAEEMVLAAIEQGLEEIGISEHSHGFTDFEHFYYDDLILDDSFIGSFQKKWLKKNKFKCPLDDYFTFMDELKKRGKPVKTGIEVCNFNDQKAVGEILDKYPFDYRIGSVHFLKGWAYDSAEIKAEWDARSLQTIYEQYAEEVEHLCAGGHYDVLGHPFNIRLFKYLPDFDVTPYLERVAKAMKKAGMVVDINTGTRYRYPIEEISPYPAFMEMAADFGLPIITTADAHEPEDCGAYIDEAISYAKRFGYTKIIRFNHRDRTEVNVT